jgi:PEP-CTERM motif
MKVPSIALMSVAVLFVGAARAESSTIIYNQPSNFPSGNVYASQNDPGGNGNFATIYDNFTLAGGAIIDFVSWQGGYFNPPTLAPIAGFTVTFWSSVANAPGLSLLAQAIAGTANESFVGSDSNLTPTYNYQLNLPVSFTALPATEYWLSIVPNLVFPPQWGWHSGTGGDARSIHDFFGNRLTQETDMAFALGTSSVPSVPEPGTLVLLGTGALTLIRRRLKARDRR